MGSGTRAGERSAVQLNKGSRGETSIKGQKKESVKNSVLLLRSRGEGDNTAKLRGGDVQEAERRKKTEQRKGKDNIEVVGRFVTAFGRKIGKRIIERKN